MSKTSISAIGGAASRSGSVQSVERALALLEMLGGDRAGYRLTDLALQTGLAPSTVHRLLTTLEKHRFVQFDPTDNLWHVGRQAFSVGSAFVRERNFVGPALPFLRRLRDRTRETANMGIIDDGEVVVLTQVESREIIRTITRVGGRVPMATSGMGKAILSTYAPADVAAILSAHGPRKASRDLSGELESIRARGYAVDDGEFVPGLRCIAAVVYDNQSEPLCAISVSGLAQRLTADRVPAIGALLDRTARDLTLALGGRSPDQIPPTDY